jgi:hypothetical protein
MLLSITNDTIFNKTTHHGSDEFSNKGRERPTGVPGNDTISKVS